MSPLGLRTVPSALREQDEGLELLSAASRRRREASIVGKWLAMLREIAPRIARAALVADPKTPIYDYFLRAAEAIAPSLAIELVPSPVETAADIERGLSAYELWPPCGIKHAASFPRGMPACV